MKKTVSLSLAVALILACFAPAFTANASILPTVNSEMTAQEISATGQETVFQDTTAINVVAYEDQLTALSKRTDDVSVLRPMCELFLTSIIARERSDSYEITSQPVYLDHASKTIQYLNSYAAYKGEIRKAYGYYITSDKVSFDNFSAVIQGDTCEATIVMHYIYQLAGTIEEECFLNCSYDITLKKCADCWKITSVKSGLPEEQSDDFTYSAFDVDVRLQNMTGENQITAREENVTKTVEIHPYAVNTSRTTYNTSSAISYALNYYNGVNSVFGSSAGNGGDCQNFASQCVWAGLRAGLGSYAGSASSSTAIPAISTARTGSSRPNVWCRNQYTTYYSNYEHNWAWDNVNGFFKLILVSDNTSGLEGPYGVITTGNVKNACAGDVVAFDTNGSPNINNATLDHAMFVTKVTGTTGSRDVSNIYVASHSDNNNSAYGPLTEFGYPYYYYVTAHIECGYYVLTATSALPTLEIQ